MEHEGSGVLAWARSNAGDAKERALDKLAGLAPGDTPGLVQHTFPVGDRDEYLGRVKGKGIFARAEKVKPSPVALADLTAIQNTVNAERLADYVGKDGKARAGARGNHHGLVDHPVVVKVGGKLYVHDGHHRLMAARLLGAEKVRARVVDLGANEEEL